MSSSLKHSVILLTLLCGAGRYANSQSVETESSCSTQPIVQCNCGLSDIPPVIEGGNGRPNIAQGRPGKTGAKGEAGMKGQKGARGQTDDTRNELNAFREELEELNELRREVEEQGRQIQEIRNLFVSPPKSCEDIAGSPSGRYLISPGSGTFPYEVDCNFTASNSETIIYHNTSVEIEAESCEEMRCSKHRISYDVSMEQIVALIERSEQCRQFIKYRCRGSILLHSHATSQGTWLSRDGTPQIYWGGATSQRDRYCACGETSSCVDNTYFCNCDNNVVAVETSDEGFLTDKDTLPVTELQFGDIGDEGERGWLSLGPLICWGRAN